MSCLKLKKFYETVNLHTDNTDIALLRDELGLPYSNVFNDYSELKCPPHLWAKSKLLTFVKQSASFLHVDGDVFIWRKFNDTLMSSGLIAQNLEIGTQYYKNAFLPLLNELTNIPRGLKKNLISLNMPSLQCRDNWRT